MGTSLDGYELLRSNDEVEETVSSPLCNIFFYDINGKLSGI